MNLENITDEITIDRTFSNHIQKVFTKNNISPIKEEYERSSWIITRSAVRETVEFDFSGVKYWCNKTDIKIIRDFNPETDLIIWVSHTVNPLDLCEQMNITPNITFDGYAIHTFKKII